MGYSSKNNDLVALSYVENILFIVRGERVILDADLASLYGVTTKALNQAIKRNKKRFPPDFKCILTQEEKDKLVTICDRFKNLKHSSALPNAFNEHGAIMAATVLNSDRAIEASIYVVRTFVQLRQTLASRKELAKKLTQLEQRVTSNSTQISSIFETIRHLMQPKITEKESIGFRVLKR